MNCQGLNASGEPCGAISIGGDGYCWTHRPGNEEATQAARSKGGEATRAKYQTEGFRPGELPPVNDHASAMTRAAAVMLAVEERRVTEKEAQIQYDGIELWLKLESAQQTKSVVNDLTRKLTALEKAIDARDREIEMLRKQLTKGPGRLRAVQS